MAASLPASRLPTSRRTVLAKMGASMIAVTLAPLSVAATPEIVMAEARKLFGDRKASDGKIKLELPTIAENGLVVPLGFEIDSPMTAADYVKAVYFFAEGNPNPQIAAFHFSPLTPKAAASIRIRLAQTQNIVAFAEMSNGDVYTTRREVKVTIGGCGG